MNDRLARIEERAKKADAISGAGSFWATDVLALVQIAKAARKTVDGMTALQSFPGVTGIIDDEAISDLRAALSVLDDREET